MKRAREFFRANPQALLLLVICLVLGIGSFLAIVISLVASGGHNTGAPEGVLGTLHAASAAGRTILTT